MLRFGLLIVLLLCSITFAEAPPEKKPDAPQPPTTAPSVTESRVTIDGQSIRYRASAGYLPLMGDDQKRHARVFLMSYEKLDENASTQPSTAPTTQSATQPNPRPVTFIFNGGPGAGSLWLHIGTAGPKRIDIADDGAIPAPPYKLKDNPQCWLDFTDLVFIDPVGTGFSRADDGHQGEYYSVQGDLHSVADVIRLYITQHDRWLSPKFIIGESYGTTRAAGLSELLHDRYGIDANGIVLISTVLDFQTLNPGRGNDTMYPLWLPSYAAVAHYHHKLSPQWQNQPVDAVVSAARTFATTRYAPALMRGTSLLPEQFIDIANTVADLTGLPVEYVKRARLRILPGHFEKELLASHQKMIGRMDGRITADVEDELSTNPDFDPSLTGYIGVFSACFNEYVRRELKFESDLPYEFLAGTFAATPADNEGYLDVSRDLRNAMAKIPTLKVEVESGWYDLATPFFATEYTINQLPLSKSLRANLTQKYYEGGHMLYLNSPSLAKLHENLKAFFENAK